MRRSHGCLLGVRARVGPGATGYRPLPSRPGSRLPAPRHDVTAGRPRRLLAGRRGPGRSARLGRGRHWGLLPRGGARMPARGHSTRSSHDGAASPTVERTTERLRRRSSVRPPRSRLRPRGSTPCRRRRTRPVPAYTSSGSRPSRSGYATLLSSTDECVVAGGRSSRVCDGCRRHVSGGPERRWPRPFRGTAAAPVDGDAHGTADVFVRSWRLPHRGRRPSGLSHAVPPDSSSC